MLEARAAAAVVGTSGAGAAATSGAAASVAEGASAGAGTIAAHASGAAAGATTINLLGSSEEAGAPSHVDISLDPESRLTEAPGITAASTASVAMSQARSFPDLCSALRVPELQALVACEDATAVQRCESYVQGLVQGDEQVLLGWPVYSVNEWGTQQRRVLVLSTQGLYRLQFREERGAIDHCTSVSLGSISRIERGQQGYKLILTQPDGRENPFSYLYVESTGSKAESRYEKMYFPLVGEGPAGQANLAPIIEVEVGAIASANRLLVETVGQHIRIRRLEVVQYTYTPGQIDRAASRVVSGIERAADAAAPAARKAAERADAALRSAAARMSSAWGSLSAGR